MYPPNTNDDTRTTTTTTTTAADLNKCLRILPHDQNTGGFFVALMELTEAIPNDLRLQLSNESDQLGAQKSTKVMNNLGRVCKHSNFHIL
jgi:hypothetical protein